MKKLIAAIMLMAGIVSADEYFRPVYGGWTNTSAVWTNTLDAVVILKDYLIRTGASNETISVDLYGNSGATVNRILQSVALTPNTNTAPLELYIVMEMGDWLKFNSSQIDYTSTNRYVLYLQKNAK